MKRVALSLLLLAGVLAGAISAQTPPAPAPQTPGRQAGPPPAPPSGPWPAPPARTVERDHTALFNGKDLTGWKISGPETGFGVEQGAIVAHGLNGAGHLFYDGTVANHVFRNFNLRLDVMARVRSNGGVYIMTEFQDTGFPQKGFEVQLNNSHTDRVRTASLYHVVDLSNIPGKDDEWMPMEIDVQNMTITISLKGEQLIKWTQPADWTTNYDTRERRIGPGTIAFQAHDPNSVSAYANIRIKVN